MGCGVSQFEQKEPELHHQQPNADRPLFSKVEGGTADEVHDADNSKEPQMKEMTENKCGDQNQDNVDEHRSQNQGIKDKERVHPNREEDCLNKFPGSPSFREYCDSDHGSGGRRKNGIDDQKIMSRMEEPPDVDKPGSRVQSVKRDSRVRRIRYAISRSMQGRKSLLNASCYSPNYESSLNNHQNPVAKPL
ncbi:hypothetical protein PanWU01x14_146200 [Parasponia andersonii]|uniref:Uncharacterized protein n=1 Tax=Parasponia andersonii TaxID=3476 RepID=A0A2P5CJM0_PARAD|nr:hypothetical protein PanWU01x14_146200 [Parasponia andersonii]